MELYEEARQRKERQEKVQAELLDKECTFKPHLICKDSKLTQSILQDCCMSHIETTGQATNNGLAVTPMRFSAAMSNGGGTTSGNTSLVVFDRLAHLAIVKV